MSKYGVLFLGPKGGSALAPRRFKTRSAARRAIKLTKMNKAYKSIKHYQTVKL